MGHLRASYAVNFAKYRKILTKLLDFDFRAFEIAKDARILDVGCGYGDDIRRLYSLGYRNVVGVEPDAICVAEKGDLEIHQGSIEDTGFPDESFDAVLVDNVFHHVGDYGLALDEIRRILRPEACLCFIEPRNSVLRKVMDFLTFQTLLPRLSSAVRMRHLVMMEEMESGLYPLWLRSHDVFFQALRDADFRVEWVTPTHFFFIGKGKRGGKVQRPKTREVVGRVPPKCG